MDYSPPGSSVHGIPRQEYWSKLPCPPPEDIPDPRDRTCISLVSWLAGGFFTISATWEAPLSLTTFFQNQWEHNGQDTTFSQSPLWSKLVLSHPALVVGGGGDFSLFQGDKILYTKLASMFIELSTNLDKLISCKMDTSVLKQLCLRNVVELTSQVCALLPCDHYRDGQSHQARTGPQATKTEKRQTKVIEITKGK